MSFVYNSIFDSAKIITKKDLCELLNLDLSRPNLDFSAAEINKAYRFRALRFHTDGQQTRFAQPIPEHICNALMNDIGLARQYLLDREDNIPGKAFKEHIEAYDWADTLISLFQVTTDGTSFMYHAVDWMYFFSSSLLVLLPLSTYSDGQLNFRYINTFSKELTAIRPYIKDIDGSAVAVFFLILRDYLNRSEEIDTDKLITQIKEISPTLLDSLIAEKKLDALLQAISEAGQELKNTLTDEFINKAQYVTGFWPQLVANMPTWNSIIGIYFISTAFTATSLPKFFNALKVISEIIIKQKGIVPFLLAVIPLTLISTLMLPVNLAIQLAIPLTWTALKATYQVMTNGFQILFSTINLLIALIPGTSQSIQHEAFALFEGSFNLAIRLSLNVAIELLDTMIFILSNKNRLGSLQDDMNQLFDTMLDFLRPAPLLSDPVNTYPEQDYSDSGTLIPVIQEQRELPPKAGRSAQDFGFFPQGKFLNTEDCWLNDLLQKIYETEENSSEAETVPGYAA